MKTITRTVLGLALATVRPCVCLSLSIAPSPEVVELDAIVASRLLSQAEKISELEKYLEKWKCDYWPAIFYRIEKLDWGASARIARTLFDDPKSSDAKKYGLGSYPLDLYLRQKERPPDCLLFATQYRDCLPNKILNGGETEFCRQIPWELRTAVGDYAVIAGHRGGEIGKLFCDVKNTRLVDILIRCLAPDNIYGAEGRGRPGESTASNFHRNQIPLVLVRLRASRAIPILKSLAGTHKDIGMRETARRALELHAYPDYLWG